MTADRVASDFAAGLAQGLDVDHPHNAESRTFGKWVARPRRADDDQGVITDQQLHAIATSASEVPGIRAVVLGGSRARGTHHEGSDVDLGLYYDKDDLDIEQLAAHAAVWNTSGPVEVTAPGSWGPWVDGGGWLTVNGTPVDLGRPRC